MPDTNLLRLSADIVAAHLAHNTVLAEAVPSLIRSVYTALVMAGEPAAAIIALEPAVPVKKSVFPGYLVCLEDGKKLTMLKRHLQTSYGLSPEQYRTKWGLPSSYPMVAPDYAARRSVLAKGIGLGRKRAVDAVPVDVPVQKIPAGKRGRPAAAKTAKLADADAD